MWETVFEAGSVEEAWEGSFIGGIPWGNLGGMFRWGGGCWIEGILLLFE